MSSTADGSDVGKHGAWRRRLILLGWLALALFVGGVPVAWWRSRPEPAPIPAFALEGLDPLVCRSIERTRQQVEANPRSGEAWGRLGMIFGAYGMRPQALVAFANAERFEPGEPRWPYFRAVALTQDGADRKAVVALQRAVELGDGNPDAPRLRLAELLLRHGDLDEAETQFDALLARDPSHAPAVLGLARLALLRDQARAAEEAVNRCLARPFVRKAAHRLLAEVRQQRGDHSGAEAANRLAEALPADKPWPDPYLDEIEHLKVDRRTRVAQALAVRARRRLDEYDRLVKELDRDYPGTGDQMEGRRLLDAKDYQGAERAFRRAIERDPEFAQAHFWRGVALLARQEPRAAADSFRETLRLQPSHAAAFDYLGRCLEATGDRAGAVHAYRSAVRYSPQLAEVHLRLGSLLEGQGRDAEALAHLERALALRPDLPTARERAERIRKRLAAAER